MSLPDPSPPVGATFRPASPEAHAEVQVKRRTFNDITVRPGFDHAADYSWLVGELDYNRSNNRWRVRYASLEEEDRFGGSVTLLEAGSMSEFHTGQMVRVSGHVLNPGSHEPAPGYRITDIHLLQNP
jgi:hypothetical protein